MPEVARISAVAVELQRRLGCLPRWRAPGRKLPGARRRGADPGGGRKAALDLQALVLRQALRQRQRHRPQVPERQEIDDEGAAAAGERDALVGRYALFRQCRRATQHGIGQRGGRQQRAVGPILELRLGVKQRMNRAGSL